jgi:hypothetical protein
VTATAVENKTLAMKIISIAIRLINDKAPDYGPLTPCPQYAAQGLLEDCINLLRRFNELGEYGGDEVFEEYLKSQNEFQERVRPQDKAKYDPAAIRHWKDITCVLANVVCRPAVMADPLMTLDELIDILQERV